MTTTHAVLTKSGEEKTGEGEREMKMKMKMKLATSGEKEAEGEEDETWMTTRDEVETKISAWGKVQKKAEEEKDFEYIIKLRKEVNRGRIQ